MRILFALLGSLLLLQLVTPASAEDDGQQAVGAFIGVVGGLMQQAIEQQRLQQLKNTPEYQDQQIQPGGLTRGQVIIVQQLLIQRGHDVGTPDGVIGPKTRAVVAQLQAKAGVEVTGYPTKQLLDALLQAPSK